MINELVLQYIQFAEEIRNDQVIAPTVKGTVLLQLAQSLNYLVPLASGGQDQALQAQQQADQHAQQMQMAQQKHQADMQMAQEKHALEIQKAQAEHQMKQQHAQDNHHMGLVTKQQQANQAQSIAKEAQTNKQQAVKKNANN